MPGRPDLTVHHTAPPRVLLSPFSCEAWIFRGRAPHRSGGRSGPCASRPPAWWTRNPGASSRCRATCAGRGAAPMRENRHKWRPGARDPVHTSTPCHVQRPVCCRLDEDEHLPVVQVRGKPAEHPLGEKARPSRKRLQNPFVVERLHAPWVGIISAATARTAYRCRRGTGVPGSACSTRSGGPGPSR